MFTSSVLIATLAFTSALAAPASTTLERRLATRTNSSPKVTHTVAVGRGGLKFEPDNIVAEVGEIVEFHFLPRNHSVVQSSFDKPCVPLADGTGFNSGFNFATAEGQSKSVFQVEVKSKATQWFYCAQNVGTHCKAGMSGVINRDFNQNARTLPKYREAAALVPLAIAPPAVSGGQVIDNPNPQAGL